MTSRIARTLVAVVTLALVGAATVTTAQASHYDLVDVDLVGKEDRAKLKKSGISTTEELLQRIAKKADRKALAETAGVKLSLLDDLAGKVDMLRVRGIGPKMVRLMNAVGVRSIAQLRKEVPEDLFTRIVKVNDERHLSEIVPGAGVLSGWISQAKNLPILLEE